MRLTALCVCGTLLAFSSLSWTTVESDEENLLEFGGFGPCAVTMRPEGPCRPEQDESTCPYLFSVPPLTFHLPKKLRELENIVEEVQKLKDSVDELRMMCADCTVRQTDAACGGQTERELENRNVGMDVYEGEGKRLKEGQGEGPKDLNNSSQTKEYKVEHIVKGDSAMEKTVFEEREKNLWEAERPSDGAVVKYERKVQPGIPKDGKTDGGRAKGKEKSKPAAVPTGGESVRRMDAGIQKMSEKENKGVDTDRKGKPGKGHSMEERGDRLETQRERKLMEEKTENSGHPVWRDVTQEAEKRTKNEDRGRDGIKMSKNPDKHTNKEREGFRQERRKEMEKGAKTPERNNKKPKQTESIRGMEKTIKEGLEEDVRQTEKEIKPGGGHTVQSVQGDSDGELALRKGTERTDFAFATASTMTSPPGEGLFEDVSLASSSLLLSSHSLLISSSSQGMTTSVDGMHIRETEPEAAVISERPGAEDNLLSVGSPTTTTADARSTLSSSAQIPINFAGFVSTTTTSPEESSQPRVASTEAPATFTTSHQNLHIGSLQTGLADHSTANKESNMVPNRNPGNKLLTGKGSASSERPTSQPEVNPNLTKNNDQPGKSLLSNENINANNRPNNHGPKQKPPNYPPIPNKTTEPGKTKPDILMTQQNQNDTLKPKSHDAEQITNPNPLVDKMLNPQKAFPSTQRPFSHQTLQVIDATDPGEDHLTEILNIAHESNPEERPVYSVEIDASGGAQKNHEKTRLNKKPKSEENQKLNPVFTKSIELETKIHEATSRQPDNIQKATGLLENPEKNPSFETDLEKVSSFGTEFTPDHGPTRDQDQPAKSGHHIPDQQQTGSISQNSPELMTKQQDPTPEPDQINQEFTTLPSEQISFTTTTSAMHTIFQAGADKTSRPLLTKMPPTQSIAMPGATSVQKSEPSLEVKPSLEMETDSLPPHISTATSGHLQKVQADSPTTSGPVKLITDVSHSAGGAEFNAPEIISVEPNSLGSEAFPQHATLSEDITTIPNSKIASDPWQQTATHTPSIQMTARPNRFTLRTLPSNAPASVPGPTEPQQGSRADSSSPVNFPHNLEETRHRKNPDLETKKFISAPLPRAQTTSTISPHLSSTKPAVSGPELVDPEVSTASTRELRVKINQVAAFFNNSVSPNGRHPDPDRHPKVLLEDKPGRGWPDGKQPSASQGKIINFGY